MRQHVENIVLAALQEAADCGELTLSVMPDAAVERPRDRSHGDWATTIALRLAKELGRSPREIAEVIAARIQHDESIASLEVAGPGFINLRLSNYALQAVIRTAREQGSAYGRYVVKDKPVKTINVEFISANPTGPMHVGHGRWAALGNAMCNVLEHAGWQVTREFYINDAGLQMNLFAASIVVRYLQLCGRDIKLADNHYAGAYIVDIAQGMVDAEGTRWLDAEEQERLTHFREVGYTRMIKDMQNLCAQIGVPFDVWFSERSLYQPDAHGTTPIEHMLTLLDERGFLYHKDGATWFETSRLGDDKDRVLVKADGEYTYFAPDIAYHMSKFNRGSEFCVNIWGADHHGYIPRMQAACAALDHEGKLTIVLGQLVNLFRGGEAVRMSKRTGEMVTFEELVEEVGADATKYFMLSRSSDQPIDFDIELAKKQDASNPVYYIQYAHARICSLLRKAAGEEDLSAFRTTLNNADLSLLVHPSELALSRVFARLSEVVEGCARDLAPFRLTHYAEELATAFHRFYTDCHIISSDAALTKARLYLADAARNVLAVTLGLLGVSAPERM